jgi:hypothetical protein
VNGRQQIAEHRARIDAAFGRANALQSAADPETNADFAKYLCVLVSGFLERAVSESVQEHARKRSAPTLQRFVENNTWGFTNVKCEKLKNLLGSFDPNWRLQLDALLVDEVKDAIDSLVANRHLITHGGSVGLTYVRVKEYYKHVREVVEVVLNLCDPPTAQT